uniref:Cytochrome c oxidase subunit 3 n=1 Tax=Gloeochaete wittrockiana TaxID=38269 RepID=A0A096Y6S4_9EUKA|nr:cytochrome c oxidase subunit 3 [Gloeochaete wittrockiana]AIM52017.1 cytochrome c oxidase subunit 3 [Gloeochaete wittrockiana]
MQYSHPFHLVNPSPWPLMSAFSVFVLVIGGTLSMHGYSKGVITFMFGIFLVLSSMVFWWRDVVRESTYEGHHTTVVKRGIRYGMLLFIASEIMFFFAFFWGFFHSSLSPAIEIGAKWPPVGLQGFNPWEIPFLNTLILLLSGATLTWSHHSILSDKKSDALQGLLVTILLAFLFTSIQAYEYINAPFSISDGIYGSTFYLATGFHGLHVIIGTIFLIVCFFRMMSGHFSKQAHLGFEAAAWYWHFVDVVWLFLFISIYWWGGA